MHRIPPKVPNSGEPGQQKTSLQMLKKTPGRNLQRRSSLPLVEAVAPTPLRLQRQPAAPATEKEATTSRVFCRRRPRRRKLAAYDAMESEETGDSGMLTSNAGYAKR